MQKEQPPFGGFVPESVAAFARLFMSPGPIFEPKAARSDPWRAARSLFAAGFRAGDIVLNSLLLSPDAGRVHSGSRRRARSAVRSFPAGVGNTEQQLDVIAHLKPAAYIGTPDFLKILLDAAESRRTAMSPPSSGRSSPARRSRRRCGRKSGARR